MNEFTCVIDGYVIEFYLAGSFDEPCGGRWCSPTPVSKPLDTVVRMMDLLNHDPPIPAVKMWLQSKGYSGMTLEEFLEQTQTEVA